MNLSIEQWDSLMFDNIGGKIQKVAKMIAWVNIGLSLLGGLVTFFAGLINFQYMGYLILLAPIVAIVGCVMSWLTVVCLYGFGKLVESVEALEYKKPPAIKLEITPDGKVQSEEKRETKEKTENVTYKPSFATVMPARAATSAPTETKKEQIDEGGYVPGRIYHSGQKVKFEGAWYECVEETGCGCVWNPKQSPAQWRQIEE